MVATAGALLLVLNNVQRIAHRTPVQVFAVRATDNVVRSVKPVAAVTVLASCF